MRRACLTALVVLVAATRLPAGTAPVPWPPGGSPPLVTFVTDATAVSGAEFSGGFDPCIARGVLPPAGRRSPPDDLCATILATLCMATISAF